jgi:hypothetical protein
MITSLPHHPSEDIMAEVEIALEQTEILDQKAAAQGLQKRRGEPKGQLKKLEDEAKKRGYKPVKGPRGEFGLRQKFRAREPVHPGAGEQGAPVQEVEFEFSLQALEKEGSEDEAAVATVSVTAGGQTESYDLFLEAPNGKFLEAREFKVERDQVVPANSWWSAVRTCLTSTCASTCVNSLLACAGTWSAYLLCVASTCGVCYTKCVGCAVCNCGWTCRWAVGCCRQ